MFYEWYVSPSNRLLPPNCASVLANWGEMLLATSTISSLPLGKHCYPCDVCVTTRVRVHYIQTEVYKCSTRAELLIIEATWFLCNHKFDRPKIDRETRVSCWQNIIFGTRRNFEYLTRTNGATFICKCDMLVLLFNHPNAFITPTFNFKFKWEKCLCWDRDPARS